MISCSSFPLVSLIIPTYNREELLVSSVKDALKQNYPNLEIIIIDQTKNHTPETLEFIKAVCEQVKWVYSDNVGIAKARNEGIRRANGEYIVFTDDDVSFDADFISNHAKVLSAGADVVQGRIIEKNSKISRRPQWINYWMKRTGNNNCLNSGKTNILTGCNFSFKRRVYDKIGGFDERFINPALFEEADWGYRTYKADFNVIYSPLPSLFHKKSPSGGVDTGISQQQLSRNYYFCYFLFAKKHHSPLVRLIFTVRLYKRGIKAIIKTITDAMQDTKNA